MNYNKHVYWGAGEPDCPKEIKAANGELHTLRCKNCDNPRSPICEQPIKRKFKLGDHVAKTYGSEWEGLVVGTYSTTLTAEGYCVESSVHRGSVQIYPAAALELIK